LVEKSLPEDLCTLEAMREKCREDVERKAVQDAISVWKTTGGNLIGATVGVLLGRYLFPW
jgi:uncharacterized protein YcfJ